MDRAPVHLPAAHSVDIVDEAALQLAAQDWAALHRLVLEQRAIFENAPVGIVITEPHELRSFNPRSAEMFGIARHEVAGMSPAQVFASPEAFTALTREAGAALVKDGFFEKAEQQFRRRDGTTFWARLRACALDPANLIAGTIWIIEDVTETREARQEIEAIMTNAAIGIVFTRQRAIYRVNPAFCDMCGYREQELLGQSVRMVYPDDAAFAEHGAQAYPALQRGQSFRSQRTMLRKDGKRLWVQMIGYQVNPREPEKGTIWMVEDRTREKADEESLREALLHNRAILENAVLGIAVVEAGRVVQCNRKMEELFRAPTGGMEGAKVRTLYPDYTSWSTARTMSALQFRAGQVHMAEHEMVRLDGTRFWARLSGRPFDLDDANGRSVWMVDDVTARREAVNAVVRARDELELRVAERTAELAGANALLQEEINERRQAEARVHHMAYHDSLTGLPNRALLQERLQQEMDTLDASGNRRELALMFIDLDRFKNINDSLGHLVGDQVLRKVADSLVTAVREGDMVARLGGDEFVVLLPTIDSRADCQQICERIIEMLSLPFQIEGRSLHITPSIGICLYPDHGNSFETLLRNADAAMYQAKAAGRNNYQFFSEQFNLAAARHFELESSLRGALARDEFELYYQPLISTSERRLTGFEVLLRWLPRGAQGKLIGPNEFIPILEDTGMIVAIGEWVLRSACKKLVCWQKQGLPVVPLAVNLSARQFMHHGLVASIGNILDETGIDPSLLELEITETALMQHGGQTLDVLRQITAMGISLSIDDFGTGYSSLAYLRRFPVRKIKIDRAFVRELEASAEDRAIVAAVMALANSLQLQVVAEGVETEGQFALLRELGCRYAQGFLFARPLPARQARALLVGQAVTPTVSQ